MWNDGRKRRRQSRTRSRRLHRHASRRHRPPISPCKTRLLRNPGLPAQRSHRPGEDPGREDPFVTDSRLQAEPRPAFLREHPPLSHALELRKEIQTAPLRAEPHRIASPAHRGL